MRKAPGPRPLKEEGEKLMAKKILIKAGEIEATATLKNSPTAVRLWEALPVEGSANLWGEEIYFSIPVEAELEKDAGEVVERGDLGFWPPGTAFCIFFGPTPASRGDEPRAASPVNLLGRVDGDPAIFKEVPSGARVVIDRA